MREYIQIRRSGTKEVREMLKAGSPLLLLLLLPFLHLSTADVGTAARYSSPYLPTACYGSDRSSFPANNLFAAATDGIWDNGASCGREYLVRCLSENCVEDQTIQVQIVDYALTLVSPPSLGGTTIVLSDSAFQMISADPFATAINVEFQQV